jgi:hypothetical protein
MTTNCGQLTIGTARIKASSAIPAGWGARVDRWLHLPYGQPRTAIQRLCRRLRLYEAALPVLVRLLEDQKPSCLPTPNALQTSTASLPACTPCGCNPPASDGCALPRTSTATN